MFRIFPLLGVLILAISSRVLSENTPGCCQLNACAMDKLQLVSSIVKMAMELQESVKSGQNCSSNLNFTASQKPMPTSLMTTIKPITSTFPISTVPENLTPFISTTTTANFAPIGSTFQTTFPSTSAGTITTSITQFPITNMMTSTTTTTGQPAPASGNLPNDSTTTAKNTESPIISSTIQTTTMPTIIQTTQMPTTIQTTQMPTTIQTTQMPTTIQTTQMPTTIQTTQIPTTIQTTQMPTTIQTTTVPSTVATTTTTKAPITTTTIATTTRPPTTTTRAPVTTTTTKRTGYFG